MKNYALLIFCSLFLYSFEYNGEVDYWKALKGVKKVKYEKCVLCGMDRSLKFSCHKHRRISCRFSKFAKQLDLKKIQITGWISQLRGGQKSVLAKTSFDLENMKKVPSLDEKVELEGSFKKWQGKRVTITGALRLNEEDGYRHFYILEDIKHIEWTK